MNTISYDDLNKWVFDNRTQLARVDGLTGIDLLLKWIDVRKKKRLDKLIKESRERHGDCKGHLLCDCPGCVGETVNKKSRKK